MLDDVIDFQLLFQSVPAAVMVLDRDLRFVTASDTYLQTIGRTLEDLIGRQVFDAFPETGERRKIVEDSFRLALAGTPNAVDRVCYTIADPTSPTGVREAWWKFRCQPMVGPNGRVAHMAQFLEEVTELVAAVQLKDAIAGELQHRVSNLFSLINIVARRTAAHSADLTAFLHRFDERVRSLALTHSWLTGQNWDRMSIRTLVTRQLLDDHAGLASQISVSGPEFTLTAAEAQMMSMAMHELTTNSMKHGALRDTTGRLTITWGYLGADGLRFNWHEAGILAPTSTIRPGFGTTILDTIVPMQMRGTATRIFGPDGLSYTLDMPRQAKLV